jgi:hypothetical protein
MAGPSPRSIESIESTLPAKKAWRRTIRHGAPLQLHAFLELYNDFSLSPFRNHALCTVFYPCTLLLQCVLTRKTCHALSSLGVVVLVPAMVVIPLEVVPIIVGLIQVLLVLCNNASRSTSASSNFSTSSICPGNRQASGITYNFHVHKDQYKSVRIRKYTRKGV